MSEPAIRVEHLGKKYRLGTKANYRTLREAIVGAAGAPMRLFRPSSRNDPDSTLWALQDVSFNIEQGEVVGLVGRNGAGKSTLLKVLSRITAPTTGSVQLRGRVGSLLEVGTGFHPELTGRENIFLNGAILGMTRVDIVRKFDEIVAFSEVEKFLDTPVKHYSSGMYMRLAFAVAAHLEPDILVVDEVLAVGDAEFQRKCMGKMEDVARTGRTVLFVSHNMGAIISLCRKALLLEQGRLRVFGETKSVVAEYLKGASAAGDGPIERPGYNAERNTIRRVTVLDGQMRTPHSFSFGDTLNVLIETNPAMTNRFGVELRIRSSRQHLVGYVSSWINPEGESQFSPGDNVLLTVPDLKLVQDRYYVDVIFRIPLVNHVDVWWDCFSFLLTHAQPGNSVIVLQEQDQLGSVVFDNAVARRFAGPVEMPAAGIDAGRSLS